MKSSHSNVGAGGYTVAHHFQYLIAFFIIFLCSIHISSSEDPSLKRQNSLQEVGDVHRLNEKYTLVESQTENSQAANEDGSNLPTVAVDVEDTLNLKPANLQSVISPVNHCCFREKKLQNIGVDFTGNSQYVDVGHCRRFCKSWDSLMKSRDFSNDLLNSSSTLKEHDDNIKERSSCGSLTWQCEPLRVKVERHYLLNGATDVEIIEDCRCAKKSRNCDRRSRKIVLFAGSIYETEKDVGICQGHCSKGPHKMRCRAVKNRTESINGPNGAVCINVIEKCECSEECYRMQYFDSFTDEIWDATSNSTITNTRILDVGRCVGSCSGRQEHQCVLWHSTDSNKCLMSLGNRSAQCVPSSFNTHQVSERNGKVKQILTISQCGCK